MYGVAADSVLVASAGDSGSIVITEISLSSVSVRNSCSLPSAHAAQITGELMMLVFARHVNQELISTCTLVYILTLY